MDPTDVEDLLQNGILLQTSKGIVCLAVDEALNSGLQLSVSDLKNVASKLLTEQTPVRLNPPLAYTDSLGDSDGFTSESSDTNSIFLHGKLINRPMAKQLPIQVVTPSSTPTFKMVENVLDNVSSNISDSDTGSFVATSSSSAVKDEPIAIPHSKLPAKKRGGWPKGRKRKPELLHLPPKAPSTGYNLYLNDQRKLYKDSSLAFHEITKLIGNKWSSLSLQEKQPYLDKAEEEKKRYREEFKNYRQSRAYQLYLANKRRKRVQNNVLSESDMDATDEVDDEDNEELYCRTCDQWFHNHHNKREHLQGKQHMQSIAGAISKELSDSELERKALFCAAPSTSITIPTEDFSEARSLSKFFTVHEAMENLYTAVKKRETEIKSMKRENLELSANHAALNQQLNLLKEREIKLQKDMEHLKVLERQLDMKLFDLWKVPSLFVVTEFGSNVTEDYMDLE